MSKFDKGHVFNGPDGQGYRLLRDVQVGNLVFPTDVEAFGGAPEPVAGEMLPNWFARQLWPDLYE